MFEYLVASFYWFIFGAVTIFVGDTFIGKYLPFIGMPWLLIEVVSASITMSIGIYFLVRSANKMAQMTIIERNRVLLLEDFIEKISKMERRKDSG